MHAVSDFDSRLDGLTNLDFVSAFFIGKMKLTARGRMWIPDWITRAQSLGDYRSHRQPAGGHGHRP